MGWATAAAAGIGALGSVIGANERSDAISDAQREQAAGNRAAQNTLQQNYREALNLLRPRIAAGDAALGQIMFELGLSDSPQVPRELQASAVPQQSDYSGYLQNNPDVAAEAARQQRFGFRQDGVPMSYDANGDMQMQPEEYAAFHYDRFGQAEGRQLPNVFGGDLSGTPGQQSGPIEAAEQEGRFDRFRETPGYQFQMEEGLRAVEGSAAARSGLLRGSTLQRLQQTGQGIADQTYNNYFGRLQQLAGMGQNATMSAVNAGQGQATNIANLLAGQGNANAQAQLYQGANDAQMWAGIGQSVGNLIGNVNWGNLLGGGGGGGGDSSYDGFAGGSMNRRWGLDG